MNAHLRDWLSTSRTSALGQRHRQRKAREARPGAEVGDRAGCATHVELERRQRVGDMDVHCVRPER